MTAPRPADPARRPYGWWLAIRMGGLDRVVGALLAVLTFPLVAVLGILVRREDGGPAFVRVERMGRDFRPFGMWKVRTMRAERPDGSATGAPLTSADDQRVTRVGARLRHLHLDELPQLWNVARGDMLLLGPRPESPIYVSLEDPMWRTVLSVPPGIAGPTQMIVGTWERGVITADPTGEGYRRDVLPAKLAIDAWYMRSTSIWLDVLTVVALVKRFLPRSKASRMKRRAARALPEVVGPIIAQDGQGAAAREVRRSA